ncbi:hypothetical protein CCACVL1_04622, partial [Corchorus capsularis]
PPRSPPPEIIFAVPKIFSTVDGSETSTVTSYRSLDSDSDLSFVVGCLGSRENASDSRGKTSSDLSTPPLDRTQTQLCYSSPFSLHFHRWIF